MEQRRGQTWLFVLAGGLVVGTLDIIYACGFWWLKSGVPPVRILQSISAGVLGQASFAGGSATAALGFVLHYFIATSMSVVYYLVSRTWPALRQQPWLYGAAYGTLLYVVMNYVVVPLSAARPSPTDPLWVGCSILVHILLIGIPIALFARRAAA